MKRFRWFVIIFLGVGTLMLLGSIAFWNKTRSFLARAQQARRALDAGVPA